MANLTLHLECTGSWQRGAKFLMQEGVQSAFLLNANPEQIQFALDHVSGIVVVRVYDPFGERGALGENFEKDIVLRHNPGDFVAWLNRQDLSHFKGNKRVRFILGWNEMYYNGADYQRKQNAAMIAVADAMVKAGYGVALHGLAADKTIQFEDAVAGVWDSTRDFLNANAEWVHLDIHEYEVTRLASAHLKSYPTPYPQSIESPAAMARSNWGEIAYSGEGIKINYHLGRIAWLLQRGKFPYARGEMGWDYKADGALGEYIPKYASRHGRPSGLNSLRSLFNHLAGKQLSDIEFCEEAYKDLEWFTSFDPDCLSNAIFADNNGNDHKAFHIGLPQYEHLYTLIGKQGATVPPVIEPPKAPTMLERRIRSTANATNVRNAPNGTILGVLTGAWLDCLVSADYESAAWVQVEVGSLKGYVSRQYVEIAQRVIVPVEKEYTIDMTGGGTMILPEHELDSLIDYKARELAGLKLIRSA